MQQIRQSLDPAEVLRTLPLFESNLDTAPSPKRILTQGAAPIHHGSASLRTSRHKDSNQNNSRLDVRSQQMSLSHLSVSHKVVLWPEVFRRLHESGMIEATTELRYVAMLGTPWLLEKDTSKHLRNLPCNVGLERVATNTGSVFFPRLTIQKVCEYCASYFSTFSTMFPLLILDDFIITLWRESYNTAMETMIPKASLRSLFSLLANWPWRMPSTAHWHGRWHKWQCPPRYW